ncbi:MAG: ATP-dependent zinc protease [Ectothiorhodospiraceae bacterium]|nr:ATP-dependent zinc protease [Ectothiorhodospiraceae bacterium]
MQVRKQIVGWREWVKLPELGIDAIKAKVDTGALTSALHAIHVRRFQENGRPRVRFDIHPLQRRSDVTVHCVAEILDEREIRSSSGHVEVRPVIRTLLRLGDDQWPIDLTLTNRDSMGFRMLLGRRAMRRHLVVDPSASYLFGR